MAARDLRGGFPHRADRRPYRSQLHPQLARQAAPRGDAGPVREIRSGGARRDGRGSRRLDGISRTSAAAVLAAIAAALNAVRACRWRGYRTLAAIRGCSSCVVRPPPARRRRSACWRSAQGIGPAAGERGGSRADRRSEIGTVAPVLAGDDRPSARPYRPRAVASMALSIASEMLSGDVPTSSTFL